jgi:hypothetical protein
LPAQELVTDAGHQTGRTVGRLDIPAQHLAPRRIVILAADPLDLLITIWWRSPVLSLLLRAFLQLYLRQLFRSRGLPGSGITAVSYGTYTL